jgi:hypothetical protein
MIKYLREDSVMMPAAIATTMQMHYGTWNMWRENDERTRLDRLDNRLVPDSEADVVLRTALMNLHYHNEVCALAGARHVPLTAHRDGGACAVNSYNTPRRSEQQSALTVRAFLASLLPATVVKAKVCHCNSDGVSLHLPAPPTGVSGIDGLEGVSEQFPPCHDNSDFAVKVLLQNAAIEVTNQSLQRE